MRNFEQSQNLKPAEAPKEIPKQELAPIKRKSSEGDSFLSPEEIDKVDQQNKKQEEAREMRASLGLAPETESTVSIENYVAVAERYIESERKREITIDNLEPGKEYEISLEAPEFAFGTAVDFDLLFTLTREELIAKYPGKGKEIDKYLSRVVPEGYREKYLETARRQFSGVVVEDTFKWARMTGINGEQDFRAADQQMEFLRSNPELLEHFRGHNIFWNRTSRLPEYLKGKTKEEIKKEALESRLEVLRRYPDIKEWDLLNEPLLREPAIKRDGTNANEVVFDPVHDIDFFVELFKRAREVAPDSKFYVNEYSLLSGQKTGEFIDFIQRLRDAGAQIDGIGIQGHITSLDFASIEQIRKNLDSLSELEIPLKITEFDVSDETIEKMYFPENARRKELEKVYDAVRSIFLEAQKMKLDNLTGEEIAAALEDFSIKTIGVDSAILDSDRELIIRRAIESNSEEEFALSLNDEIGNIVRARLKENFDKKVEKARSDYVKKAMTIFYGTPSVHGIYIWGIQDRVHWRSISLGEHAGLFDDDFRPNQVGEAYLGLTQEEWRTKVRVVADGVGQVNFRGFPGQYSATPH